MAMESNPDIVTIMLGTNDAKGCNWDYGNDGVQGKGDLYKNDYADFIAELKALPSRPKVFVVSPPPLFSPWPYNMSAHAINVELPTLLRKVRQRGMRSFYRSPLDTSKDSLLSLDVNNALALVAQRWDTSMRCYRT
jgi:lysophospholipase L1-like esterase